MIFNIVFRTPSAVVMMRIKRSPEPMRSFSFSGFDPNGQLAAFTGMAEYRPTFGGNSYGPPPPSPQASAYYGQRVPQDSYGPPPPNAPQDSYGPPPSGAEQPAAGYVGSKPFDSKEQSGANSVEEPSDSNRKQHRGETRARRR